MPRHRSILVAARWVQTPAAAAALHSAPLCLLPPGCVAAEEDVAHTRHAFLPRFHDTPRCCRGLLPPRAALLLALTALPSCRMPPPLRSVTRWPPSPPPCLPSPGRPPHPRASPGAPTPTTQASCTATSSPPTFCCRTPAWSSWQTLGWAGRSGARVRVCLPLPTSHVHAAGAKGLSGPLCSEHSLQRAVPAWPPSVLFLGRPRERRLAGCAGSYNQEGPPRAVADGLDV